MAVERPVVATWVIWGLAAMLCGFANLAVMGFHPIVGQQIVNYGSLPVALLLAAVATQAIWPSPPRWMWVGYWLGAVAIAFGIAPIAGTLAPAMFQGVRGPAGYMSPFILVGAAWMAGLALALPGVRRWPGLAVAGLFAVLYFWASAWDWAGADGELFGSALLTWLVGLGFAVAGLATEWATRRAAA